MFDFLSGEDKLPDLEDFKNDLERAEYLQRLLINMSTNDGPVDHEHYIKLRKYFLKNRKTEQLLPNFVIQYRDLNQFWQYIKHKLPTYAARRQFIWNAFHKLLNYLDGQEDSPLTESIHENLQ